MMDTRTMGVESHLSGTHGDATHQPAFEICIPKQRGSLRGRLDELDPWSLED